MGNSVTKREMVAAAMASAAAFLKAAELVESLGPVQVDTARAGALARGASLSEVSRIDAVMVAGVTLRMWAKKQLPTDAEVEAADRDE